MKSRENVDTIQVAYTSATPIVCKDYSKQSTAPQQKCGSHYDAALGKHNKLAMRAEGEAATLHLRLKLLRGLHDEMVLSAPDVCMAYIIAYLQTRHGATKLFASRRKSPPERSLDWLTPIGSPYSSALLTQLFDTGVVQPVPLNTWSRLGIALDSATLFDILQNVHLSRLPEQAAICLANWYMGRRRLVLLWNVPSCARLLQLQASGKRCASVLTSEAALRTVFGHRGCLEMLLHDFSHAEKFVEAGVFWQQVGFFEFLSQVVAPIHSKRWAHNYDHRWRLAWNYVSSDMNAISAHMMLTLKCQLMGAVARAVLRRAGLVSTAEAEYEATLEDMQADIYPTSASGEWRPALQASGLEETFEEEFSFEWKSVIEAHVEYARVLLETAHTDPVPASPKQPGYASLARPCRTELIVAFEAIGSGWRDIDASPQLQGCMSFSGSPSPETGCYGKHAHFIIAHMDELGRRVMAKDASA